MAEQNNQQKKGGQQQDANQLIQVRYDKLHELQANGKNPFEITKYDVTHHSTDIKDNCESLEGQEVTVAGRMLYRHSENFPRTFQYFHDTWKHRLLLTVLIFLPIQNRGMHTKSYLEIPHAFFCTHEVLFQSLHL